MKPIARNVSGAVLGLLFILLTALPVSAATGPESSSEAAAARAAMLIEKIRSEPNSEEREKLARLLPNLAASIEPIDLEAQFIDDLAALLIDSNNWVRMGAATSLAALGPPAQRVLPAMNAAARSAFREEYGDNPVIIAETGIHTWGVIAYAAAQLETPDITPRDALYRSLEYVLK
jgi:1,6-anhydro-N-acetylmuramate kinase